MGPLTKKPRELQDPFGNYNRPPTRWEFEIAYNKGQLGKSVMLWAGTTHQTTFIVWHIDGKDMATSFLVIERDPQAMYGIAKIGSMVEVPLGHDIPLCTIQFKPEPEGLRN